MLVPRLVENVGNSSVTKVEDGMESGEVVRGCQHAEDQRYHEKGHERRKFFSESPHQIADRLEDAALAPVARPR